MRFPTNHFRKCIFYSLKDSAAATKSATDSIQIDATVAKTPKVREDTNQKTRQVAVQLNIVEDDETVTTEPS